MSVSVQQARPIRTTPPIVLVATGQSNIEVHPSLSWTPEANLYLWNFDGVVNAPSVTGTAFAAMDATTMGVAYSWANEIAKANPLAKVYLINLGDGGQPISKWMTGGPSPDCYAMCKNNVEAALTALSLTKIDQFMWWQGETDVIDGTTATYFANFNTVMARFRAESWFPFVTPITIMGVSHLVNDALTGFNSILAQCAAAEPEVRAFVGTGSLLGSAFWDAPSSYIHMTAAGYEAAGKLAFLRGRAVDQYLWIDPLTGSATLKKDVAGTVGLTVENKSTNAAALPAVFVRSDTASTWLASLPAAHALASGVLQAADMVGNFFYFLANAASSWVWLNSSFGIPMSLTQAGNLSVKNVATTIRTVTADFTVAADDAVIINNKGSACVGTLPSAASFPGREITITNIGGAFATTSASSNVVPRAGGSAGTAILAATDGVWADLKSDGSNWRIIRSS